MRTPKSLHTAVLIPCYNEALTIGTVVRDFQACLPGAAVYVFDNNSSDETKLRAREAGAIVRTVGYQGKGNVVRRMFAEVKARQSEEQTAYRTGHRFGNVLLTRFAAHIFGRSFSDMLSGYRIFSNRFVKSFPAHSTGFEIETELTVHALELRMPVAEIQTPYKARPEGSASKLRTYHDGIRILLAILKLFKAEKTQA